MKKQSKKNLVHKYEQEVSKSYLKLQKAYKEIKDSYAEMVLRLALVAEFKDEATGAHLVRIADYSTEIAKGLKLSKKNIELLRYSSLMHDIGKLVIPDSIMKKRGGLTPQEREIVKKHPKLGADIFIGATSSLLKSARIISLTHHERFDGTGYPQGLRGSSIPVFGRIVSLADVFDALTSKRSYKEAYDFDDSIEMIKRESGKQFDPEMVSVFLKRKKRIKAIWQATRDIQIFIKDS